MTRIPCRAGWLLAMLLLLFPLAAGAVSDPSEMLPNPRQEQRAEAIGEQLRCLVCQNESIEQSDAGLARDLRRIIRRRVIAGDSNQQIIAWMVAHYGDFIRLKPPFNAVTLLLWGAPVIALGVGTGAVLIARRHPPPAPAPLTAEEQRRAAELLGR